jgi:putative ABC transport system substrate-binding protein
MLIELFENRDQGGGTSEFRRRRFLVAAGATLASQIVRAQGTQRTIKRIGCLSLWNASPTFQKWLSGALNAAGWTEGRNLIIEWRWGAGKVENLASLATDLVNRRVDLIVAVLNDEILAARRATPTIPIVMLFGCAPVEIGLIESLRRPGGNITGTTWYGPETAPKSLQALKQAVLATNRVAVLRNPLYPGMPVYSDEINRAATSLGIRLQFFDVGRAHQLPTALKRISANPPDALYFAEDPILRSHMGEVARFAIEHKLISAGSTDTWVDEGGLLSYAANSDEIVRRAATYIDRILRGALPADLPAEEPTRYDLSINLKTANAIGLKLPASLLARADKVID